MRLSDLICVFFFKDTATAEIYTLSLPDALPISSTATPLRRGSPAPVSAPVVRSRSTACAPPKNRLRDSNIVMSWPSSSSRSEEHTSELQSRQYLVCRLLLEKKTNRVRNCPINTR